ncbi:MAG: autotransporter adhesin family protein [Planctomycetes bacterium]|nr:autotransporter adhesin family protein [Planctomycetota bacterium]
MTRFCAGFGRYVVVAAAAWWLVSSSPAPAANDIWDGNFPNITDNLWGTGANWVDNTTPGNNDTATFNGGATVFFNANPAAIQGLTVSAGNVTFTSSGGERTLAVNPPGAAAFVLLSGGALLLGTSGNPLHIAGIFDLTVRNGSVLNLNHGSDVMIFDNLVVAATGGGNGTINVEGAGSELHGLHNVFVGTFSSGIGTINVGTTVNNSRFRIDGSGALVINATGTVNVGDADSTGTLEVHSEIVIDGGILSVGPGSFFSLFPDFGQDVKMTIEDGGRGSFGGDLFAHGTYKIIGAGSELEVLSGGLLEIADGAQINVGGGGSVSSSGGITLTGPSALLSVDGTGSTVNIAAGGALGIYGLVNVNNGGALTVGLGGTTILSSFVAFIIDGGTVDLATLDHQVGTINLISGSLSYLGDLTVGTGGLLGSNVTLNSDEQLTLSGTTTVDASRSLNLNGGTLNTGNLVVNGTFNFITGTLSINGPGAIVDYPIVTGATTTINVNANFVQLGSAASLNGFNHQGVMNVGSNTVTLASAGYARLGVLTTLAGGTISAPNGVVFPSGSNFLGRGSINTRVSGEAGSVIEANGALALGSASSPVGFNFGGELRVRQHTVTLNSSAQALLGDLTTLGSGASPGTLIAANGAIVDFGNAVTGYGTISSTNTLAKRTIINGVAQGNSMAQPLTFTGYVKGLGSFDNVTFTGTFDPGLSTTIVTAGNLALSSTSTLIIELGGTTPGSGHDQIDAAGTLALDGTLLVALANGFGPASGNSFDLFNWATSSGMFDTLMLPALSAGLAWNTSQLYVSGVLSIVPGLPGDYNFDGTVDAADYVVWRKGFASGNYATWRANFGETASGGAGDSNAVPEPRMLVMFSVCVIIAFAVNGPRQFKRRRRAARDESQTTRC